MKSGFFEKKPLFACSAKCVLAPRPPVIPASNTVIPASNTVIPASNTVIPNLFRDPQIIENGNDE
jgi:hypothetical protein